MSNGFIDRMDEGIFFKSESYVQLFLAFAGKVDSDCANWDGLLRFGKTEFDHKSMCWKIYLEMSGFDSRREIWYWYLLVHFETMVSTSL